MFYNKYLYENKMPLTFKELLETDTKKALEIYLHLPASYYKNYYLYLKYDCRHEYLLYRNCNKWYEALDERKRFMNKLYNLGIVIEFLIDSNLQETADNIINGLKKIWISMEWDNLVYCMDNYRTSYELKNKKNKETGKIEIIKKDKPSERLRWNHAMHFIEYKVLTYFNCPASDFTITRSKEPFLMCLLNFEKENVKGKSMEEDVQNILNLFIDENNLIAKTDYFRFYKEKQESWGKVFVNEYYN